MGPDSTSPPVRDLRGRPYELSIRRCHPAVGQGRSVLEAIGCGFSELGQIRKDKPPIAMTAVGRRPDVGGAVQDSMGSICVGAQLPDEARLGRGQKLRERSEVRATGGTDPQHRVHVDADHVPARREPQLALARQQHVPGLALLVADQGVLAVGAEPSFGAGVAAGAGQAVVAAGSAVFGPSAWLEVPAAEGPKAFFAAFSSTCRSVNSQKTARPPGRVPSPQRCCRALATLVSIQTRPEREERSSQPVSGLRRKPLICGSTNETRDAPEPPHGFVASAQKSLPFSTTCTFVKPAATSVSARPLFGCPE